MNRTILQHGWNCEKQGDSHFLEYQRPQQKFIMNMCLLFYVVYATRNFVMQLERVLQFA